MTADPTGLTPLAARLLAVIPGPPARVTLRRAAHLAGISANIGRIWPAVVELEAIGCLRRSGRLHTRKIVRRLRGTRLQLTDAGDRLRSAAGDRPSASSHPTSTAGA